MKVELQLKQLDIDYWKQMYLDEVVAKEEIQKKYKQAATQLNCTQKINELTSQIEQLKSSKADAESGDAGDVEVSTNFTSTGMISVDEDTMQRVFYEVPDTESKEVIARWKKEGWLDIDKLVKEGKIDKFDAGIRFKKLKLNSGVYTG